MKKSTFKNTAHNYSKNPPLVSSLIQILGLLKSILESLDIFLKNIIWYISTNKKWERYKGV
jgi:hypothetical protein